MSGLFNIIERIFWSMMTVVGLLIIFVFVSHWTQSHNVPLVGNVFGWAQTHAGLEQ